jgi:hypothetical protein
VRAILSVANLSRFTASTNQLINNWLNSSKINYARSERVIAIRQRVTSGKLYFADASTIYWIAMPVKLRSDLKFFATTHIPI